MGRSKTFLVMKTNVADFVQDPSSTFLTRSGKWINDAYQDAWRRFMWTDLIVDDQTFASVVGQQEYSFSTDMSITDFGEEIFIADITHGHPLERTTIRNNWKYNNYNYKAGVVGNGNPAKYKVLSTSLVFDVPAESVDTYAMPYKKTVTDLSGDSDEPVISTISLYLEQYAISMALAYKKKYGQSTWWANIAENTLRKLIVEENVAYNQLFQRMLASWRLPKIGRLLGDQSYDTV